MESSRTFTWTDLPNKSNHPFQARFIRFCAKLVSSCITHFFFLCKLRDFFNAGNMWVLCKVHNLYQATCKLISVVYPTMKKWNCLGLKSSWFWCPQSFSHFMFQVSLCDLNYYSNKQSLMNMEILDIQPFFLSSPCIHNTMHASSFLM